MNINHQGVQVIYKAYSIYMRFEIIQIIPKKRFKYPDYEK